MSSKIASSKYKHAVPKSTRTEWYTDLPVHSEVGSDSSRGIKASRKFIAFPFASAGGSVGVLQLSPTGGKFGKDLPVLSGHTAPVTDLDFSPFDDHLLATASEDTSVKVWRIPEGGLTSSTSDALFTLRGHDKRVEAVAFNTAAGNVLASAGGTSLKLWDVSDGSEKLSISFPEAVLSASWKSDGSMLTTTSKDKKLRTLDPRTSTFAQEAEGHSGVKTSLSIWLGDKEQLLSTGFSKTREREYFLWDTRNLAKPLKSNQLDTSTGVLLPLYDEDSCMLFLGGKGDGVVRWFELVHDKSPYFQWEGSPSMNQEQQKGITLVPKLALNVTKCEVAQVLRLTQNAIVPLSFGVPRKTYSLFHDDLYPDTKWTVPGSTAAEWFAGENKAVPLFPVDPARRPSQPPASSSAPAASSPSAAPAAADVPAAAPSNDNLSGTASSSSSSLSSAPASRAESQGEAPKEPEVIAFKDIKYKNTGVRTSKFRYISGKALHPSTNYDHLKDLSLKMSGECDALAASSKLLAVPLNKPGGQIGIIPLSKMGRQPPKLPALVNGGEVLDFVFNPFDPCMLAAACDDSYVRVWKIPEEGLTDDVTECHLKLSGHRHRVNLVRFHPLVSNVLISSSTELGEPSIKYWDLTTGKEMATLGGFQDQVFGFDHNYDGSKLVTVSKDKMIRIFDPRSKKLLAEGPSHDGVRGARVVWCGKTDLICTVGFDRGSQREIRVYNAKDLSKPLGSLTVDVSPGVLVPWFDEDTSVLFLWGRGDSSVSFFEIVDEKPYVHFLTKYEASSLVIGQVFQPKQAVDVKAVEIAKSYVLCQSHIESVSFTVPRTRLEFFQDDIYPPTRDLSKPTMDAPEWFAGTTKEAPLVSMQPADMKPVTEAPVEIKPKKYESRKPNELSKEEQEEKVLNDMFKNVRDEAGSGPLPQELKEGVEDSEWD